MPALPRPAKKFFLGLAVAGAVFIGAVAADPGAARTSFSQLDVGQGDAELFEAADGGRILIDGGPGRAVLAELGDALPWWSRRLDAVILTHPDGDHLEGLVPVLDRLRVGAVILTGVASDSPVYRNFLEKISQKKIPVYFAVAGENFEIGGARIEIFWPKKSLRGARIRDQNDGSIVAKISACRAPGENPETCDRARVLVTGDAGTAVEAALVAAGADLRADVLKVSHHGSDTGSSEIFLKKVGAAAGTIGVGAGNSFGHPREEILRRLAAAGMAIRRTDLEGRVKISF